MYSGVIVWLEHGENNMVDLEEMRIKVWCIVFAEHNDVDYREIYLCYTSQIEK